jgi:hypothetical protein
MSLVVVGYEYCMGMGMGRDRCVNDNNNDTETCGTTSSSVVSLSSSSSGHDARQEHDEPDDEDLVGGRRERSLLEAAGTSTQLPISTTSTVQEQCESSQSSSPLANSLLLQLQHENEVLKQQSQRFRDILEIQVTEMANRNDELMLHIEERDMKHHSLLRKCNHLEQSNERLQLQVKAQHDNSNHAEGGGGGRDMISALDELRAQVLQLHRQKAKDQSNYEVKLGKMQKEKKDLHKKAHQLETVTIVKMKEKEQNMTMVISTMRDKLETMSSNHKVVKVPISTAVSFSGSRRSLFQNQNHHQHQAANSTGLSHTAHAQSHSSSSSISIVDAARNTFALWTAQPLLSIMPSSSPPYLKGTDGQGQAKINTTAVMK